MFGPIQSGIRFAEQLFLRAPSSKLVKPDADRHLIAVQLFVANRSDVVANSLQLTYGIRYIGFCKQDGEFFAAVTRRKVIGRYRALQDAGDLA